MMLQIGCTKNDESDDTKPDVITVGISNISPTYAVGEGNLSSGGGSDWINRGICWSDIIQVPTYTDNKKLADGGGATGTYSVVLDNLTPGTEYYVRAFATNSKGFSYGDTITFTTTGSVIGEIAFNPALEYNSVSDIEGNSYKTIEIGSQTWMAENLKTTKYNDGQEIPEVTDLEDWIILTTPAVCFYLNNKEKYKNNYGALYNWYSVDAGKICPTGWHVPDALDWGILYGQLGGGNELGFKLMETGTTHWITNNFSVTNSSGFTALPGGLRQGFIDPMACSYFEDLGYSGSFWTSTPDNDPVEGYKNAFGIRISGGYYQSVFLKTEGHSVRCIKD